jgi:hypothetical protein
MYFQKRMPGVRSPRRELRITEILGSCVRPCNPSYLISLYNTAGLTSPALWGKGEPMSPEAREHSFDELARALASGSLSRRKALRLMGGLLVGGTLGSLPGVAWADDRCPEGQTRCGERCVNLRFNERHCGSCFNRCRSTQTCCNGRCVNRQTNERHCGSCGNRCPEGSECVVGTCSAVATTLLGCLCNDTSGGGNITRFVCRSEDCNTLEADKQTICPPLCESAGGFSGLISCQADSPEC